MNFITKYESNKDSKIGKWIISSREDLKFYSLSFIKFQVCLALITVILVSSEVFSPSNAFATSWPSESARFAYYVEKSDRIVTGMVTDKETSFNHEDVWISVYEWLKGKSNENQVIVKIEGTDYSPERKTLDLKLGDEVLLMLKEIDPARGYYGLVTVPSDSPPRFSIAQTNEVKSLVKTQTETFADNEERQLKELLTLAEGSENCKITNLDSDSFLYCTYENEDDRFYVPISITIGSVKKEILKHISEEHYKQHFNLKRAWDEAIVNGHSEPSGQTIEYEYKIANFTFLYLAHVGLGFEKDDSNLLYLQYVPPREISDMAIQNEGEFAKLIYDPSSQCLELGTRYVLDTGYAGAHMDRSFSPSVSGRGPPEVYDRYGEQIVQAEKRFLIWPETGEIGCTSNVKSDDDIDKAIGRSDTIVLMDASDYLERGEEATVSGMKNNFGGMEFPLIIGIGVAVAGIIAFIKLRKRK